MAIKDWKQVTNQAEYLKWKRRDESGGLSILLLSSGWEVDIYDEPLLKTKHRDVLFGISIDRGYVSRIKKQFKIKSQALKFAKSYMRKH